MWYQARNGIWAADTDQLMKISNFEDVSLYSHQNLYSDVNTPMHLRSAKNLVLCMSRAHAPA